MSNDENTKMNIQKTGKKQEKILFSDYKIVCFACGEKIDKDTDVCPYCETSLI